MFRCGESTDLNNSIEYRHREYRTVLRRTPRLAATLAGNGISVFDFRVDHCRVERRGFVRWT